MSDSPGNQPTSLGAEVWVGETRSVPMVLFCCLCFANDSDGGSWGGGISPQHCFNCGAGGSVVSIPAFVSDEIRKNASWVGKRYYPCEEDLENHAELVALRNTITEFPGRTAEACTDRNGDKYWRVQQNTGNGLYTSQTFPRLEGETPADGLAKARTSMRYVPEDKLR